jgi:hypothetical protein
MAAVTLKLTVEETFVNRFVTEVAKDRVRRKQPPAQDPKADAVEHLRKLATNWLLAASQASANTELRAEINAAAAAITIETIPAEG